MNPAQQRPVRRQPCLQHPAERRAHERAHDQQAHPRMPEDERAGGKKQSLPREVHRLIGRLHGDVDAFEMRPHRGGWIGQPAVDKGVAGEQKAEIVGNKRQRNWRIEEEWPGAEEPRSGRRPRQTVPVFAPAARRLRSMRANDTGAQPRPGKRRRNRNSRQTAFKNRQRGVRR